MSAELAAGLIAGAVSIIVAVISFVSNRASTQNQIRQSQYSEILSKRIELYPKLWKIHITYETNWVLERKDKNCAWARSYLSELNEFNVEGGLFFSQALYSRFAELRDLLCRAVEQTPDDALVEPGLVLQIREVVYGSARKAGLSTYEKDDLGSYRSLSIQRRREDA